MRRFLLLMTVALLVGAAPADAKKKHLLILHTNDTHSCVMPLNANLADTALAGRGGYLRRLEMIRQERAVHPDLLLFDSGDAATIGNHEFDFGLDNMARIFRLAEFPIVCTNYDFTGTVVEGLVKPYIILKRQGLKIGVFGLAPMLESLVDDANCPGVKYLDPAVTAQQMIDVLKKKKCDVIICLSHLGWKIQGSCDDNVIPQIEGLDLVLGGHSHSYLEQLEYVNDRTGKPVPVDQNGKHAIWVGRIEMELSNK